MNQILYRNQMKTTQTANWGLIESEEAKALIKKKLAAIKRKAQQTKAKLIAEKKF